MADTLATAGQILWLFVWQASACLVIGIAASLACRRHAARSHAVLVFAVIAALAAPLITTAAKSQGWGLLPPAGSERATANPIPMSSHPMSSHTATALDVALNELTPPPDDNSVTPIATDVLPQLPSDQSPAVPVNIESRPIAGNNQATSAFAWRSLTVILWGLLTAASVARLALSCRSGWLLVRRARPIDDQRTLSVVTAAAEQVGLARPVSVLSSEQVRCPAIWCWSSVPKLVLPAEMILGRTTLSESGLQAIACHELAHWKRRDHATSLLTQLLCGLLPWHPLAYWVRRRLDDLAERACDLWTIRAGHAPADYAETLLRLATQPRPAWALAAASGRGGLTRRVRELLSAAPASPLVGRWWLVAATALTASLVLLCATAQRRTAAAPADSSERVVEQAHAASETPAASTDSHNIVVPGVVQDANGLGIEGAPVFLFAEQYPWDADPRTVVFGSTTRVELARGHSGAGGEFRLSAAADMSKVLRLIVFAKPETHGVGGIVVPEHVDRSLATPLTLTLPPPAPVSGQLLSASGSPVAGATVRIASIQGGSWGINALRQAPEAADSAALLPPPVVTDREGNFTLSGLLDGATAKLEIAAADHARQTIDVATPGALQRTQVRSTHFESPLVYVLESPHVIEGTITDAETRAPLAEVDVSLHATNFAGGRSANTSARTDANGRYRMLTGQFDFYILDATPTAAGHIGYLTNIEGKTVAAQIADKGAFRHDIRLAPGKIVRGRVVDASTGAAVTGASIAYVRHRGTPTPSGAYFTRNRSLTDASGEYSLTAPAGKGTIVADLASEDYIRRRPKQHDTYWGSPPSAAGMVEIDVASDVAVDQRLPDITVSKGIAFQLRVSGPDGQPVAKGRFASVELTSGSRRTWAWMREFSAGAVPFTGAEPGHAYKVFLCAPSQSMGAVVEVTPQTAGEQIAVQVQPTGTIRGRLVRATGAPAGEIQLFPKFFTGAGPSPGDDDEINEWEFYYNFYRGTRSDTDDEGRFELPGILPGLPLLVSMNQNFASGRNALLVPPLGAGEVRDLGDLRLAE